MQLEELLNQIKSGANKGLDLTQEVFPVANNVMGEVVKQGAVKDAQLKASFESQIEQMNGSINKIVKGF
jgi:hypothetical protein